MSRTVEKVKADIEARIAELDPNVKEHGRLVQALEGINASEPKPKRARKKNSKS